MLQQRLNALIKARVPTTIWFLSLMSPLRKSTKIRKKVASLIPMIPTKWYGNHMACSTDRRIWKCPCKLFSFFNFFGCQLDPEGSHFYRAKKPVVFTQEMAFRWRNSYRETIPSSGKKETKQNKTQHLPHSQPEVLLKKWIKKILLQRIMLSIIKVQYHIHRIYIYNLKLLLIKICKICT